MKTLAMYDIHREKIRRRVIEILKDYGFYRIQFSIFAGDIDKKERDLIIMEVNKIMKKNEGELRLMLVDEKSFENKKNKINGKIS